MRIYRREKHPDAPKRLRPWAVSACSQLLFLQAAGLLFLTWMEAPRTQDPTFMEGWLAIVLFFLGLLALLASVNFLRMHPPARNRAMLVQGLGLSLSLMLYPGEGPVFIYPLMIFSVFIVLYLQHPDVRESFPYQYQIGTKQREKA